MATLKIQTTTQSTMIDPSLYIKGMSLLGSRRLKCLDASNDNATFETSVSGILNKTRKVLSVFGEGRYLIEFNTEFRRLYQIVDGFKISSWLSYDKRFSLALVKAQINDARELVNNVSKENIIESGLYIFSEASNKLVGDLYDEIQRNIDRVLCFQTSLSGDRLNYMNICFENDVYFAKDIRVATEGLIMLKMGSNDRECWEKDEDILLRNVL